MRELGRIFSIIACTVILLTASSMLLVILLSVVLTFLGKNK